MTVMTPKINSPQLTRLSSKMEQLQNVISEIQKNKRKQEKEDFQSKRKYMRRGDEAIARIKKEPIAAVRCLFVRKCPKSFTYRNQCHRQSETTEFHQNDNDLHGEVDIDEHQYKIDPLEVSFRLRARGQPIRLFGESDNSRIKRLQEVESQIDSRKGQQNDYARQLARTEAGLELEFLDQAEQVDVQKSSSSHRSKLTPSSPSVSENTSHEIESQTNIYKPNADVSKLNSKLLATDPDSSFILVYVYIRRVLDDWEHELQNRSDSIKRSVAGKHDYTKFIQTKENLKPFFKLLKRKAVENDVMGKIADILFFCHRREYVQANAYYLQLSIGNAPWPIGVTMVGIHERSAREKIFSNQVAHVLNDESQRKWIQSIKRIMSFLQQKYPPDDPTKMIG